MTLFKAGAQFPPQDSIERLSRYERMRKLFEGNPLEVYERATEILKDSPHADQLKKLYIAVNLADILATKPADLLVGEPPNYESGEDDASPEQVALNQYVEENDLNQLIHESATANGYRGDAWIKTRFGYVQDYSELTRLGLDLPSGVLMEPVIEHVDATTVFPETSRGNVKRFKAVNIATVEWVSARKRDIPYLNVERHIPGYIQYSRYLLSPSDVVTQYGAMLQAFNIVEQVETGREQSIVATGLPHIPVFHVPYKSVDDTWEGIGGLEKIESKLAAINDRLVQIDFILWKHADPTAYGPDLEGNSGNAVQFGGKYIPVTKDDVTPGYMTWNAQLDAAFRELDLLISAVFIMSETPQWLFGTTMAGGGQGGTGTSHTDGGAIKSRFMPIISKVRRIKTHYDRAIRDALYTCFLFDKEFGDYKGATEYPVIEWSDGLPKDDKIEAEIAAIRTGGKATLDVQSSIKRMDGVDDSKANEILRRIVEDDDRELGTVDASIFNEVTPTAGDDDA